MSELTRVKLNVLVGVGVLKVASAESMGEMTFTLNLDYKSFLYKIQQN